MKIVVLGGTIFIGRHFVESALRSRHELTLFHRGKSGPNTFPRIKTIFGDRARDLRALGSGSWDAVVDMCGYHSGHLRTSCEYFKDRTALYLFVSSVSVYRNRGTGQEDESAPLHDAIESLGGDESPETYAGRKIACEGAVREAFGDRALIVRPGLVAGPFDPTDRFTYWPSRVARGGTVLAPGNPDRRTQFIDVRDLADWLVIDIERGLRGTFNAAGDARTMSSVLETCRAQTGSDARLVWVSDQVLIEQGAVPYTEIPLWIPGIHDTFDSSAGLREGLRYRPLHETVADTWAWDDSRQANTPRRNGLSAEREKALLATANELPARRRKS